MNTQLLGCAAIVAAVAVLILRRAFSWRVAIVVALIKVAIPAFYFSGAYDGTWTIIDDVTYYRQGRVLLASGFNPLTAIIDTKGLGLLLLLSDGPHFLYGWFNLLAQFLLAEAYWAPVLGNVLLTCVAAVILRLLARDVGASSSYADGLALFFLFHWEVLAWSSFLNVKDLLVMTLTLWMTRSVVQTGGPSRRQGWAGVLIAGFLLLWIRFYVPLVVGGAYMLYKLRNPLRNKTGIVFSVVATIALFLLVRNRLAALGGILQFSVPDLVFGWLRTLLSPQPWSLQREYGFLLTPSVLNVAALPMLAFGAYLLARDVKALRFVFLYALLLLASVAAHPELQGPRHRIQILFIIAWAEFHGLYVAAAMFAKARAGRAQVVSP